MYIYIYMYACIYIYDCARPVFAMNISAPYGQSPLPRLSLLRFVGSDFPGNSLWA